MFRCTVNAYISRRKQSSTVNWIVRFIFRSLPVQVRLSRVLPAAYMAVANAENPAAAVKHH